MLNLLDFVLGNRDEGVFRRIPLRASGRLYTSPMPFGAYDRGNRILKIYKKHRVEHVIMLVTDEELEKKARRNLRKQYDARAITYSQFPFRDFLAPSLEAIEQVVEEARTRLQSQRVAVHCHAGVGRTGVAVSCIVMDRENMDADQAIEHVRRNMTINLTAEQIGLIRRYGEMLAGQSTYRP